MIWGLIKNWHLIVEGRMKCTNAPAKVKEYAIVDEPDANVCQQCKHLKLPSLPESLEKRHIGIGHRGKRTA